MAETCPRCGEPHTLFRCPHVRAIELDRPGDPESYRRVEFLTAADFAPHRAAADGTEPSDYPKKGR